MHGHRYIEREIRLCVALLPMQRSSFEKRARYSVPRCKNQSTLLNWETVIRSMPVVMRLPDLRHPMLELHGLFEFFKVLSPAQATMLDPIQMGLRIIRLGCSRFTIEHRSYQLVRLQGTNVIQIFLFAFCDRASVLPICSPSLNPCDPDFSVQLCLTRSRWVFESYPVAVRVLRSNIEATNSFAFKEPM